MRLKDKALIEYFGKNNINEEIVAAHKNTIDLRFAKNSNIDLNEVAKILSNFPSIKTVVIYAKNAEQIERTMEILPKDIEIKVSDVTKQILEELRPGVCVRVRGVYFARDDKTAETIDIDDIVHNFPGAVHVSFPFLLTDKNITYMTQVQYLLRTDGRVNATPDIIARYQEYCKQQRTEANFSFESQAICSNIVIDQWNQANKERMLKSSSNIRDASDEQLQEWATEGKEITIYSSTMADMPLALAEKLKSFGIKAKIRMQRYDNGDGQNEDYALDEYIAMSKVMEELIGDIDENLPEEERFRQIYERIVRHIEYDHAAQYPKNKQERAYAKENDRSCRNLKNGLLYGKAVCAGYADILKNACAIKGIECEYIQGPVDKIKSREAYLAEKKRDRKKVVFSDDKSVIVRSYHAWNKVKINGVWYNVDPTLDRKDIVNDRIPKYAFLSDEIFRKLGRPTVEVLRHPCQTTLMGPDKSKIFSGLEPSDALITSNKIIEFESTVDEYGEPREFPMVPKEFPWTRIMIKLKTFAREQQANVKNLINRVKSKKNPSLEHTQTSEFVINNEAKEKRPSWELSSEKLSEVKAAERGEQKKETEIRTDEELEKTGSKDIEIGE